MFQVRGAGGAEGDDVVDILPLEGPDILQGHIPGGLGLAHHLQGQAAAGLGHREGHGDIVVGKQPVGGLHLFGIDKILDAAGKQGGLHPGTRPRRFAVSC